MSTLWLAVVIFLLADGTPANKAKGECWDITRNGDDGEEAYGEGDVYIDSRGALIFTVTGTHTITCMVTKNGQKWVGQIHFQPQQKIYKLKLSP